MIQKIGGCSLGENWCHPQFSPVHPRIADDHFLKGFSQELRQLLREMLQNNPKDRPTAAEVLARLFAFTSLTKKV